MRRPLSVAIAAAAALWIAGGCRTPVGPISVQGRTILVENRTPRDWRSVIVTVNDHFTGGTPRLAAGSRLTAPLGQFQTAFGQRYDADRQMVIKVEVTATDSEGEAVKLSLITNH
jgi:hypothetical protein